MQIQALISGNSQPTGAPTNTAARPNTETMPQVLSSAKDQVGGLQQNAVAPASSTEKQSATLQQDVDQAVQQMNETLQALSQKLEFSVDKDTDTFVVKVMDKETKEVIRQIPSEEMLNLAKTLDKLQGLLIKDVA